MYQVQLSSRAEKALEKLPESVYERLVPALQTLASNPRPSGCKKLKGRPGYRIRVGDYRIIYEVEDNVLWVYVIEIGHRREIYD